MMSPTVGLNLAKLVTSKGLLGFIYGVFIIGLYTVSQSAKAAPILMMTAELLAWVVIIGARWQFKQTRHVIFQKQGFTYLPIAGYLFFNSSFNNHPITYVDGIILAFLVLTSFWGLSNNKARTQL